MECTWFCIFSLIVIGTCERVNEITEVERYSRNVIVLCDLPRSDHQPLYWNITGLLYDLGSVPNSFTVQLRQALIIKEVKREMQNWVFQCSMIINSETVYLGQKSVLRVVLLHQSQPSNENLLLPSRQGRVTLNYQRLNLKPNNEKLYINWEFNTSDYSCTSDRLMFKIHLYRMSDINNSSHVTYTTTSSDMEINSTENYAYSKVVAIDEAGMPCAEMKYYQNLLLPPEESAFNFKIYANNSSASFKIPEQLLNDNMVQLIWSKNDDIQCVCPPVQNIISDCACNQVDTSNSIIISGEYLHIVNLTKVSDMNHLMLYFINTSSDACNGSCQIRSVAQLYQVVLTPEPPSNLVLTANESIICFNSSFHPDHPPQYEVNITDTTGYFTSLNVAYNLQCLDIPADVCSPYLVSVAAINDIGTSNLEKFEIYGNGHDLCQCYERKVKVTVGDITSSTANLMLQCLVPLNNNGIVLNISSDYLNSHSIFFICNSSEEIQSLLPETQYAIMTSIPNCPLSELTTTGVHTGSNEALSETVLLVLILGVNGVFVVLLLNIVFILIWKYLSYRNYTLPKC